MIWELYVCIGVSWGGCAVQSIVDFPDDASCYRALAAMRFSDPAASGESGLRRSSIAYCRPKQGEFPK